MDLVSFALGFLASVWGLLQIIYPEESKWFYKQWLKYLEKRILVTSLTFILLGSVSLLVVWYTNSFLALLVLGSFMLYTGLKYRIFGRKVIELSKISLNSSANRWRIMGLWLLLGGLGLIYISTWF